MWCVAARFAFADSKELTLVSLQAVAISDSMDYSLVRHSSNNSLLIMATERVSALSEILDSPLETLTTFPGSLLLSTTYISPLDSSSSSSTPRIIFPASYVTSTTGTGLVHAAPAHGVEDWEAWRAHQLALHPNEPLADTLCAVDGAGKLMSEVLEKLVEPEVVERLGGKDVLGDGTGAVIELLQERGTLLKEVEVRHKFPYDWRTKKPVIFR
jgi:isoleucyl-tRNA synthetase